MSALATDGERLRIALVLEGGRSRSDAASLSAVARALEQSGAEVHLIRHGLGRLSTLQVQRAVQKVRPHVLISTGIPSSRHLRRTAERLGCPLVCYFWPNAPLLDPHRRPRKKPAAPTGIDATADEGIVLQHAVVGSQQQLDDLLQVLGKDSQRPRLASARIHVLPPLLDAAIFDAQPATLNAQTTTARDSVVLGVYGTAPEQLCAGSPGVQAVSLDGAPVTRSADTSEAQRLAGCSGLVVVVQDAQDARDAARRIAVALVLGKPVLLVGFGSSGRVIPAEIQALDLPPALLRAVPKDELPQALAQLVSELHPAAAPSAHAVAANHASLHSLREALHPNQVLSEHVALLFEIADLAAHIQSPASAPRSTSRSAAPSPSLSLYARALGLRFSRKPQRLILRYQAVVSKLRGFDSTALITKPTLEQQLQTLLSAGYQPVSLSAMALQNDLPSRCVAVTFDGGHAGVATLAAPLLKRLGIPFTVFVATDLLVDDPVWPWPDLLVRALADPVARGHSLPLLQADPRLAPLLAHPTWPQQAQALRLALARLPAGPRKALIDALRARLQDHIGSGPPTGHVDASSLLTPLLLPQIRAAGGELGSHGCSLVPFASLDDTALERELTESRRVLITHGERSYALAPAPLSDEPGIDARVAKAAAAFGYQLAVCNHQRPDAQVPARFALLRRSLSESASTARDGTFDAHRLWLSLTRTVPR